MAKRKKLSKKQAEVWDRLKNGIPKPASASETLENAIAEQLAKNIKDEVDKEILNTLLNAYTTVKKNELN